MCVLDTRCQGSFHTFQRKLMNEPNNILGAGIAIGVAFGLATGNVGFGIALGIAIGASMSSSQKKKINGTKKSKELKAEQN